nr:retrovirus-related Pol polyprotein from transposon TNT 1-94 [Tanacetum cinerariifolium]
MTDANKTTTLITDVYKKAHSALLLCLDNKVLREVNKEDSAAGVWLKLETLYMTKSLANKLYLKKKLRTFYMDSGKKLSEHIYEFNKLIGDLANIDVDIDDKDQALMLLTSLPPSYDNFMETLLYERESLTLEDVLFSLNSRELKKRIDAKDDGDGLYLRERSDHQSNQGRGSSRSKSKGTRKSTGFVKKNVGQGFGMHSEGYDNGDLLMEVSEERFLEWIIDSGSSFHMTPRRDFLFVFKEFNGGTVLLGNNRACASMGIGNARVQMKDGYTMKFQTERVNMIKGSLMVFPGTIKGNCVYSLDSWAKLGLHELDKREVLGNNGLGKLEFCENCVLGKSTRQVQKVEAVGGNQTGRKLKKLRTNNSLEFRNREFNKLCKESGITRHLTVAGTPQQNGLAERMNKTLLNKVRCLLIQSSFSDLFWAEATVTTTYLINRSPSTILEKKTHMDLRSGHPGYRLWRLDDVKPKIIISKEVVFNESLMYKYTLKGAGVADSEKEVEFEVELQGIRVEPTQKRTTFIPARYKDEGNVSLSRPSRSKVDDMAAYAMEEEMSSLKKNHTWELVDQPPGQKLVSCKWLYKIKEGIEGVQKPRCKARLVAQGFTQRVRTDYNKSPRQWYKRFDEYMINNGFSRSNYDSCVYFKEFAP